MSDSLPVAIYIDKVDDAIIGLSNLFDGKSAAATSIEKYRDLLFQTYETTVMPETVYREEMAKLAEKAENALLMALIVKDANRG